MTKKPPEKQRHAKVPAEIIRTLSGPHLKTWAGIAARVFGAEPRRQRLPAWAADCGQSLSVFKDTVASLIRREFVVVEIPAQKSQHKGPAYRAVVPKAIAGNPAIETKTDSRESGHRDSRESGHRDSRESGHPIAGNQAIVDSRESGHRIEAKTKKRSFQDNYNDRRRGGRRQAPKAAAPRLEPDDLTAPEGDDPVTVVSAAVKYWDCTSEALGIPWSAVLDEVAGAPLEGEPLKFVPKMEGFRAAGTEMTDGQERFLVGLYVQHCKPRKPRNTVDVASIHKRLDEIEKIYAREFTAATREKIIAKVEEKGTTGQYGDNLSTMIKLWELRPDGDLMTIEGRYGEISELQRRLNEPD